MEGLEALLLSDPQRAISLMERLEKYVITPHPGQIPVVVRRALQGAELRPSMGQDQDRREVAAPQRAQEATRRLVWWVAPTYRVVKRGYKEVLRQLPRDFLTHDPPPDTNFDAGRPVVLQVEERHARSSSTRPSARQGMLGEGVDFVVQDEAASTPADGLGADHPPDAGRQGGRRPAHLDAARAQLVLQALASRPGPGAGRVGLVDLPLVDEPVPCRRAKSRRMRGELPALMFAQEVEAKFLAAGSSVFAWEERSVQYDQMLDNHMIEDCPPKGSVFLGSRPREDNRLHGALRRARGRPQRLLRPLQQRVMA